MAWTPSEAKIAIQLARSGNVLNKDIASQLGKKPGAVSHLLRTRGIKNNACAKIIGKWNSKHAHIRKDVMTYFVTHSAEETAKKFKLTSSEFKSLMTVSYRLSEYRHLRKDKRRHDAWTKRELKFLLTHAGLMPREWIGRKLNRGNAICIKERLEMLNVSSKTINGITKSQFVCAFGSEPTFFLTTKAGPCGQAKTTFKIVPWVWMNSEFRKGNLSAPKMFKQLVESMAIFQEWIHGPNPLEKMQRICRKSLDD